MPSMLSAIPGLIFVTLCYAALCAFSPYGSCRKCHGWGSKIYTTRFTGQLRRGRLCRRCEGTGRRLRVGRALYNAVSRLHREGNH
ncbi:hypothetical protein RKE29_00925 [Streptomyces sp. B1866]|uniref:hypothetical protein n=1 Tax=Streptomyces sp. B1866 TaxID=3075431 RepID=UPI00288E0CAF|nr:hypothetical protein [Streptomyces sp. B1866]MDT3395226.1 hypothetical protein [Streptomyces sp. B1866]